MVPMEDLVDIAKNFKESFIGFTDSGDMPPVVLVERDDNIEFAAVSYQVDKNVGLAAAKIINSGFGPDALVMLLDTHMASKAAPPGEKFSKGDSSRIMREMSEEFPPGSMMEMAKEEWPLRAGLITACLTVVRVDLDMNVACQIIPYSYYGKGKGPFRWIEDTTKDNGPVSMGGGVVDSLKKIMSEPRQIDLPEIKEHVAGSGVDNDRARLLIEGSCVEFLQSKGYICLKVEKKE